MKLVTIGCLVLAVLAVLGAGAVVLQDNTETVACDSADPGCESAAGSASFCNPAHPGCEQYP